MWENEDLLVDDIQEFNRGLMNYLIFYNTQRPHTSLSYLSPLKYLLEKENFSKMLWTYTGKRKEKFRGEYDILKIRRLRIYPQDGFRKT